MDAPTIVQPTQPLYTVLVSETLAGLVEDVNMAMRDGWRCVGAPFESLDDGLCQAMIRDPALEQANKMMQQAFEFIARGPMPPLGKLMEYCVMCGGVNGEHQPGCPMEQLKGGH